MSIIYNTLDRLEKEGYAKTEGIAQTEFLNVPDTAVRKTGGRKFPAKPLVLIFTLVLAAAALTIWQKNHTQKAPGGLPARVEESTAAVAEAPAETEKPTLASIIAAQPAVDAQEKLPTTATVATDQPAVEALPKAIEVPEPVEPQEKAMPKGLAATESVEPMDVTLSNAPIETRLEGERDASATDPVPETISRGRLVTPPEEPAAVEQPVVKTTEPAVAEVEQKNTGSTVAVEPVVSVAATPGSDRKASEPSVTTRPSSQTLVQTLIQPNVVDEILERVRVALSYGQYMRALSELSGLSPRPTGRADYWFMKGSAHLGLEQLNQAEEAFEAAQTLLPDQPQIAVQLAIINQEKGDHEKAVKILSKAAESHPNVPEIFLNQGYSLLTLGAVREAEHNFRIFMRMTERRAVYAEQRQAVKQWLGKAAFNDK